MVVVVERDGLAGGRKARHQVVGGIDGHRRIGRDRMQVQPRHRVATPAGPGGDGDVVGTHCEDILRCQRAVAVDFDVGHHRHLAGAKVGHPAPGRKAGQQPLARHAPAQHLARLGQSHIITAQRQRPRRL